VGWLQSILQGSPQGSVLSTAFHVWRLAAKGEFSFNPSQLYRNFTAIRLYDNAKPRNVAAAGGGKLRWMTFDDQWVDEVQSGFKSVRVCFWYPIYCE
jgi:POT family proton-dependent oligopeptide transporter